MGRQKPDPHKQQLANIEVPPEYQVEPKDPEIYHSTSPWQIMDYNYELRLKSQLLIECLEQAGLDASLQLMGKSAESSLDNLNIPARTTIYIPDATDRFGSPSDGVGAPDDEPEAVLPDGQRMRSSAETGIGEGTVQRFSAEKQSRQLLPCTDGKDYFYRNKMEYALYWDNREQLIKLAFHQRNSHRKIPFEQSSIERPEILARAKEIIAGLNSRGEQARTYQSLMLRCDQQGKVSGGLFKNHEPHPIFEPLEDTLLGHTYTYSVGGFFQINLPVYELALEEIQKHITTDKVLDLYSGVGTIGLSVARDKQLTLVETNPSAHAELVKNCEGLPNATPILAKSEEATDFIQPDTTVIVDPPRAGLHAKLVQVLCEKLPEHLIYLSCNPHTQARDIKALSHHYAITSITPFNFFPHTPHLENLITLKLK